MFIIMKVLNILSVISIVASNSKPNVTPTSRIVGGYEVNPKFQYPWIVSLQYYGRHACGGALFNEKTVITAAHCIIGSTDSWTASIHRHDLTKSSQTESGITYKVIDRIFHPKYNRDNNKNHDVAIWKLNASGYRLSDLRYDTGRISKRDGNLLKVIGWGTTSSQGRPSSVLLEVKVSVFNAAKCKRIYKIVDTTSQFCAGYNEGGKDSCQGDSGGPIFTTDNGVTTLVGVVSWGSGCASKGYPGVYTRISEVMDFIEKHSKKKHSLLDILS